MAKRNFVSALALLVGAASVGASSEGLQQASKLRDAASKDYAAHHYQEAVAKLQQAASLYEVAGKRYLGDWAVCERALVWNYFQLRSADKLQRTFLDLVDRAKGQDAVSQEVAKAYRPVYKLAKSAPTYEAAESILTECRRHLLKTGQKKLAAQTLHDLAGSAADHGDVDRAVSLFRQAIAERRSIEDWWGVAWSTNDIAFRCLNANRDSDAAGALVEAYRTVLEHEVADPQVAVAINLRTLLRHFEKNPQGSVRKALWRIARAGATSRYPRIVPLERVLRPLLAGDPAAAAALKVAGAPPEVTADLKIRAARAAVDKGDCDAPLTWLKNLDVGDGPCAPRLQARCRTARALALAGKKRSKAFLKEAAAAAKCWTRVADIRAQRSALAALAAAATTLSVDTDPQGKAILAYRDQLRSQGTPGGAGGRASSGGNRSGYRNLPPHGPLFTYRVVENTIRVEDRVSGRSLEFDLSWSPKNAALNGVSFTIFGGYVSFHSIRYGGGAAVAGGSSTTTLDALDEYHPIPGKGELVLLKDGAIAYR